MKFIFTRWHFFETNHTRMIALSFLLVILLGSTLLCLPISSRSGQWTSFLQALFTATSATCVTGLVMVDTYTYWSVFGQLVILIMIQIGGVGLMSIIAMFFLVLKKKISLNERVLLMQSSGNMQVNGVIALIKRILIGTFLFELIGAFLLAIRFCPRMGLLSGVYNAVFHSISAFCNAGFDLMGKYEHFSSFTAYETDALVSFTLMALIIIGGIGFLVWNDLLKNRLRFSKYTLHTKLVLTTTVILLTGGTIGFYLFEQDGNLAALRGAEKWLSAGFMSVTTRTAGFNTMNTSTLSESGTLLSDILMFIGGSPGSTAGGIKTSTIAIIFLAMFSMSNGVNEVTAFQRRLETDLVKQAAVILIIYLSVILLATIIICHIEPYNLTDILFETVSAAGTVGLSRGVTPNLSAPSHIILILLMYTGRIGGLSLIHIFREKKPQPPLRHPAEKILIG